MNNIKQFTSDQFNWKNGVGTAELSSLIGKTENFSPQSATPRTDAIEERNGNVLCGSANLEFARTLERELAAAKAERALAIENFSRFTIKSTKTGHTRTYELSPRLNEDDWDGEFKLYTDNLFDGTKVVIWNY